MAAVSYTLIIILILSLGGDGAWGSGGQLAGIGAALCSASPGAAAPPTPTTASGGCLPGGDRGHDLHPGGCRAQCGRRRRPGRGADPPRRRPALLLGFGLPGGGAARGPAWWWRTASASRQGSHDAARPLRPPTGSPWWRRPRSWRRCLSPASRGEDDGDEPGAPGPRTSGPTRARMAAVAAGLGEALAAADPACAAAYRAAAEAYAADLLALDAEIEALLAGIPAERRKLVTSHHTLGYFADRYGFEVLGAIIPGGATYAEPSPADLAALVNLLRREGVRAVFAENTRPGRAGRDAGRRAGRGSGGGDPLHGCPRRARLRRGDLPRHAAARTPSASPPRPGGTRDHGGAFRPECGRGLADRALLVRLHAAGPGRRGARRADHLGGGHLGDPPRPVLHGRRPGPRGAPRHRRGGAPGPEPGGRGGGGGGGDGGGHLPGAPHHPPVGGHRHRPALRGDARPGGDHHLPERVVRRGPGGHPLRRRARGTTWGDLVLQGAAAVVALGGVALFYRPLLVLCFNEQKAATLGLRPAWPTS